LLGSGDLDVRVSVIAALSQADTAAVVRLNVIRRLVGLFDDKDEPIRAAVVGALQKLSKRGLASEILAVASQGLDEPEKCPCAIRILSELKTTDSIATLEQTLLSKLDSPNGYIRSEAAAAMGTIGGPSFGEKAASKLLRLTQDRSKRVRASAITSLAFLRRAGPSAEIIRAIELGLDDRDDHVRTAASRAVGLLEVRSANFVDKLLQNLKKKPHEFKVTERMLFFHARRPVFIFPGILENEVEQRNYWKITTSVLSEIKLEDPERVVNVLSDLVTPIDLDNAAVIPYVVTILSKVGSKYRLPRALEIIFLIAKQFGEPFQMHYQIRLETGDGAFLDSPYPWASRRAFFEDETRSIARNLEPKDTIRQFKSALEDSSYGSRLLALEVVDSLDPNVTSELYPVIAKRLGDDEDRIRSTAWKVIEKLSISRGLWQADPSIYADRSRLSASAMLE